MVDHLVWWTEGYNGNDGWKGRLGPWLWKLRWKRFQSYRITHFWLTLRKWVSTLPNQDAEPLYLWSVVCFWYHRLFHQSHLSGLSSPNQAIGNWISLPCWHFPETHFMLFLHGGIWADNAERLFPHNWKEFLIMRGDVSHDEVLDCFQFQLLLMTVFQSPSLSPSLAFSLWTFCSLLGVISQDNMLFPSFPFSSQIDGSCVKCTLLEGPAQKRCYCIDLHKFHQ